MKMVTNWLLLILAILTSSISNAQVWQQLSDFPSTERDDGVSFTINQYVYCGSGLLPNWSVASDFYRFDLNSDTWDTIASLPLGANRQAACGFSHNGMGYVFGGYNNGPLNDLWQYNPVSNSWIQKASKPGIGLSGASCFVLNGKAYIIGGNNGNTTIYNEVWEYTIANDSWVQKSNFPASGSWRASAIDYNNTGYLIFGKDSLGTYNRNLYQYYPQSDTWTILSNFPGQGRMLAALRRIQNALVIFAGVDSSATYLNSLWYFSLSDSLWYQGVSLPAQGRKEGICFNSASALYYTIGLNPNDVRLKETWKIDNVIGVFEISKKSKFKVYPIPCSDFLHFQSKTNLVYEVELQNGFGQTLILQTYSGLTNNVNVSQFKSGLYILKIKSAEETETFKILVSH